MIPNNPKKRFDRKILYGELDVFEKLNQAFSYAGDEYIAFHSLNLPKHPKKRWSEIDFVIVCPYGIYTLEVKEETLNVMKIVIGIHAKKINQIGKLKTLLSNHMMQCKP